MVPEWSCLWVHMLGLVRICGIHVVHNRTNVTEKHLVLFSPRKKLQVGVLHKENTQVKDFLCLLCLQVTRNEFLSLGYIDYLGEYVKDS